MKNKTNIKNLIKTMPKPLSYGVHYDWVTVVMRPTTDPALLLHLKGIKPREIAENERKTKIKGYSDAFKAQIASPLYGVDGSPVWSGQVDISYRRARRQLKYQRWVKNSEAGEKVQKEDLETGTATKSNTFGDSTAFDYNHGFYSDKARYSRLSSSYPVKAFKYGLKKDGNLVPVLLSDFFGYDKDKSSDDSYNKNFIQRIDDDLDPYYECAFKLSGGELGLLEQEIPVKDFLKKFGRDASTSRVDLTLDIEYETVEKMELVESRLNKLAGMVTSSTGAYVQEKDMSYVTAGSRNKKSPLRKASLVASTPHKNDDGTESDFKTGFGQTLYLGARTGDFFLRVYNKTADAMDKRGEKIPPTLRVEIEAKGALSKALYPEILKGASVESLFVETLNEYVTFGDMPLLDVLKIKFHDLEKIDLDLRSPESEIQRTRYIMRKQWSKKIRTITSGMSVSTKIIYALDATGVLDEIPEDDDDFVELLGELSKIRNNSKSDKLLEEVDKVDLEEKKK